ncbi:MAG TPA: hypothetical protein DCE44_24890 [Verrucomicrobiales bacterium]|nr:hypothetical protein [Verrucomicrobiales bacterium]
MAEPKSARIFISYSHDSAEHAERVLSLADQLKSEGLEVQIDQDVQGSPAGGWPKWMRDRIQWADFVLMVCTQTYHRRFWGEEEPDHGLGATWEGAIITSELYQAGAKSTKFVPLVFNQSEARYIPEPLRNHTHYSPLVREGRTGYEGLYAVLTGQQLVERGPTGSLRKVAPRKAQRLFSEGEMRSAPTAATLHGVPALPPHFLPRPAPLEALKESLLKDSSSHVAITGQGQAIGVQGMGGLGKSALAAAAAHDTDIRKGFPDGVVWLSVGQQPNLIELQGALLKALTGEVPGLATVRECADAIREALTGRKVLVILDDVWEADHASLFRAIPAGCRLLVTTRNAEVLVGLGAQEQRLDLLSPLESLKILAEWSGRPADALPAEAEEIVKECGRLPLALAAVGALVRLGPTGWKDALTRLQRSDLDALKKAFPEYPYPHLLRALDVSVEALPEDDRARYLDLAVFPEDVDIPESPLRTLWGLDDLDTRAVMNRLAVRSLATVSACPGESLTLRLHDLQRDLLRKRRKADLQQLHVKLVERWEDLLDLPDSYAWQWIGWHLAEAGQKERLAGLLLNDEWLEAKLQATNINSLLVDVERLRETPEFDLLANALRLSAHVLTRRKEQVVSQLHSRLLGTTATRLIALRDRLARRRDRIWLRSQWPTLTPLGTPLRRTLEGHSALVFAVAPTPDGRRIVSGSKDSRLKVWDLERGECVRTLEGHSSWICAVALTPDGRQIISGSADNTLKVWDLERGECQRTLEGHSFSVNAVAITPDGQRIISGSQDGTFKVWDPECGECLRTLEGHSDSDHA